MKITKRQLKRIIKEEKARLINEYENPVKQVADRAIGMYFDVRMMESFEVLVDDMYQDAMDSALEELDDTDALEMVQMGLQKLFNDKLRAYPQPPQGR